jgi:hypothetical protein
MRRTFAGRLLWGAVFVLAWVAAGGAHHGSAEYVTDREISVTGTVTTWRWTSPHTRVHLAVRTEDGATEAWEGEGPPLAWADERGWSETTLREGETVTLVMYPARRRERGGLVKRILREGGEAIEVSRPWLDR